MTRTSLLLLALPLCALAADGELWLVELEHNDGLRLQFQGAEVELGSAPVWRLGEPWQHPLRPGDHLALQVTDGVATRIELLAAGSPAISGRWQRAEDRLRSFDGRHLVLATLGTLSLDRNVRWVNGSATDLHEGSALVLLRSADGVLREITIINPEE
ncbi:hypothetical protein [Aeromonas dhakensis]|uniref:hypothetical protein n=1 Tax=Aeromonas dhakensis TaxID=196024 RepID=UPI0003487BB7|nr:hypothetical protein [Aeromonas dhakensis]KMK97099.1 hypothetical protein VL01_06395 [Aeromonas enteropelogenes]MBW3691984.1 hypothetical protein [Aeromonas dhakensis]MDH0345356.1 hypothetical protein [Aeromonas dhakensis]HDX8403291.1 hypothetical protein [Aeromonas dhakensis]